MRGVREPDRLAEGLCVAFFKTCSRSRSLAAVPAFCAGVAHPRGLPPTLRVSDFLLGWDIRPAGEGAASERQVEV